MKRLVCPLKVFIFVCTTFCIHAQSQINRGNKLFSVYSGFINPEPFTFSIFSSSGAGNPSPSINTSYIFATSNRFSLGPFVSFYEVDADYNNTPAQFDFFLQSPGFSELISGLDCVILGNCDNLTVTERVSVLTAGIKLSYTRNIIKNIESYLSMHLGYSSIVRRQTITDGVLETVSDQLGLNIEVPSFVYFTSVGGRYFFSRKLALFSEIGFGNSHLLTLGATLKIGY